MVQQSRPFFVISLVFLLVACASKPQTPRTTSPSTPFAEVQAKKPDDSLCNTISTMAITIMVSRHLLGQGSAWLTSESKEDFPGFDSTIESMIKEAYEQKPVNTIGKATMIATQFKDKWTNHLAVCVPPETQA